jgi:uncharacterized membrane protein
MDNLFYILLKLLDSFDYNLPKQAVKERLFSDPGKGVVPIINTLDFFGVKSVVANVQKEVFNELPKSFIAQVRNGNQLNFVLIKKVDDKNVRVDMRNKPSVLLEIENFVMNWTGVIIAIEKNEKPSQKKPQKHKTNYTFVLSVLLIIFYIGITSDSFFKSIYLVFSLIGVYTSYLIIKEKLTPDGYSSKFCSNSSKTDCQSVINSKEAKIFNAVDLSDASIIYFSFISIIFIIASNVIVFKVLSFLSLPLILFSAYYQYFKIKKWCALCLIIIGVLLLQFSILTIIPSEEKLDLLILLPMLLILSLIIISWMNFKKLLITQVRNEELRINNLSFKRNYHLFLPYYKSLPLIDTSEDSIIDISIGNPNANVRILTVTNPFCEFCFETHKILMKLLEKYENQILIRFRFFIPYENRDNPETQIAERLMDLFLNEKDCFEAAFQHWYSKVSIQEWFNKWGKCKNESINNILKHQQQWSVNNNIDSRPAILINEKFFPKFYTPEDIKHFIKPIIDFEDQNKTNHAS